MIGHHLYVSVRPAAIVAVAAIVAATMLACGRRDAGPGASARVDTVPPSVIMLPLTQPPDSRTTSSSTSPACVVTDSSMGPVRLGMTLAEARNALAGATFERVHDGEGVASVNVTVGSDSLMVLTADGDEDEAIDWAKRIVFMETFSSRCRTADGVHSGALVVDVEKILGRVERISLSEIESRQFVRFERHPERLTFRLDYTGIFDGDARETVRFEPEARIFSIAIAGS